MRKLSKVFAVVMALCMALLCVACGDKSNNPGQTNEDNGKTYNLVFTTHLPETGVDGASLKYFLEQVTKETKGRVTFETYFGGSMTKSGETLEAVSGGLADIAFVPEGFYESQFYPLFVAMLPYSTTSEWVANKALKEMFDTYEPFTEMCKKQGVVNLGPVVPSEVVIVSTDKAINGLDDMQGLKIRAMGAVNSEMTMLGATPVALDASEIYEALERDTVAAATGIPVTLAVSYKLQEVADYFIFSGIGTYTTSSLYMNEKTWNSLPTDIQEAFRTVYDRFVDEYSSDDWIVHHRNGYQTFKAIMSLSAITGNFDTEGGNIPAGETYSHQWANFDTREHEFIHANTPDNVNRRIGYDRFPLWNCFIPEAQMTDFHRHVLTGDPYPIKAIMAFGLNHRMFPEPHKILEALDTMDFVVSSELFMTETCKHADIVLPVCTSLEREEFKVYPGGFATYIKPVVPPVGESRPDSTIISDLVGVLGLDDPLLASGYRKCVDWMLQDLHFTVEDCLAADLPIRVPDFKPYVGREYTNRGYDTPTGKFELSSYTVEQLNCGLSPIPDYEDPYDPEQTGDYPFTLSVGARLPFVLHSRLHDVPWTRSLRPDPMVDMNEDDAAAMGIELNDWVWVENETGRIHVRANPSSKMMPGMLQIYHGYKEADANELVPEAHLDEYSGYPGYNCVRCRIIRDEEVSHS